MRKLFLIGLLILTGLSSCNKNDDENCHPETVDANWTLGKEIIIDYNTEYQRNDYSIINGENILFAYNHSGAQCDNIYDDEWGECLTFIINKETTNFELTNEDIMGIKCFYQEYGAWVRHNQYQIKDGIIKGKKISEKEWEIIVSVMTTPLFTDEQPQKIEFTKTYSE